MGLLLLSHLLAVGLMSLPFPRPAGWDCVCLGIDAFISNAFHWIGQQIFACGVD